MNTMLTTQILLQGITLEQLNEKILDGLEKRIQTIIKESEKEQVKYYSRTEVAELLSISLPTLHSYCKKNIIQSYRCGRTVRFKSNEIEESLIPINQKKR